VYLYDFVALPGSNGFDFKNISAKNFGYKNWRFCTKHS
jgi:hypothetical protein